MTGKTTCTEQYADALCEYVANGKSLIGWIKKNNLTYSTVWKWIADNQFDLSDRYAKAKCASVDYLAEELQDIADDGTNDWMETEHGPKVNAENIARSRLRVDTRKWIASKLKPKVYGDKLDIDAKIDATINVQVVKFADLLPVVTNAVGNEVKQAFENGE